MSVPSTGNPVVEQGDRGARVERVKARLRALAQDLDVHEMDERRQLPPRLLERLSATGVRGIHLPKFYGGADLGHRGCADVVEQLATIDVDLAALCVLHCTSTLPILRFGSPALRDATLPGVASGALMGSLAITEPEAGSNPRAVQSRLRPDGEDWRLTGSKMFIGQAAWTDLITVLAKAQTADGERLTAASVRRTDPGVDVGLELETMGVRATPHSMLSFDDVRVTPHGLLGGVGRGLTAMDAGLAFGRLMIGAIGAGAIARAGLLAHRFATRRTVATGRLVDSGIARARLHAIASAHEAVVAACHVVAERLDGGADDVPPEVLMAVKVAGSELAFEAADTALQLLGGRGYVETNGVAKVLRDSRFLRIGEGATDVLLAQIGAGVAAGTGFDRVLEDAAPGVAGELRASVEHDGDPWAAVGVGRLATWALLEAATVRRGGSGATLDWIASRRAAARAHGAERSPVRSRFDAMQERLGSLDEVLAIPPRKLDPYLRRRPPDTGAPPIVAVEPQALWRLSVALPVDRTWRSRDGATAELVTEALGIGATPERLTAVVAAWLHRLSGDDVVELRVVERGVTVGCRYAVTEDATVASLERDRDVAPTSALTSDGDDGDARVTRLVTGVSVCLVLGEEVPDDRELRGVGLVLHVADMDGPLSWRFDPDVFDPETIRRRAANLRVLAQAAAAAPDKSVTDLDLLPADELRQVVHGWNGPEARHPDELITTAVERQVDIRGDAPALVTPQRTLSYVELERDSNRVANALLAGGLSAGATVAVCGGRVPELVLAALAVLKAGGCFVLLDPAHPADRLAFMLEQAGCERVLAVGAARASVPDGRWRVDDVAALAATGAATRPAPRRTPADTAYVVFTSGSTGRPKGVLMRHRNLVDQMHSRAQKLGLGTDCVALQAASVAFDIVAWEFFGPLAGGGRLVLSGADDFTWDPEEVLDLVDRFGVTVMQIVPSQLQVLLEHLDRSGRGASLRVVVSGGEMLPRSLQQDWLAAMPDCRLQNHYGPTETTVESTWWVCRREDDDPHARIGTPTPNTRVYVLDGRGRPTPVGVPGEATIGGPGVSGGYLGMEDLSAERFPPDPWSADAATMYRTGDRVRYRPDGTLEFLGRVDRQLKVRGVRLEPGEIEGALMTHPAVARAVVTVVQRGADKRLAAYVVPAAEAPAPTVAELGEIARDRLPREMVPNLLAIVDGLPTTATGKVDLNALPPIQETVDAEDGAGAADALEREVLAAWSEVLGREVTRTDADFFELGGHSLLAARMLARVRERRDVDISVRAFFEEPTVRGVAAAIRRCTADAPEATALAPSPARTAPVSRAMESLRFLERFADIGVYNVPTAVRVRGPLDLDALDGAMADLVTRHEALRSRQLDVDGRPVWQLLGSQEGAVSVVRHDACGLTVDTVRDLVGTDAARPFGLADEPPLRVGVWRLGPDDAVIAWTVHHTVADGWSSGAIIPRDLAAAYRARSTGAAADLPPVVMGPAQYHAWRAARSTPDREDGLLEAWAETLDGAPAEVTFPHFQGRSARPDHRGRRMPIDFDADLSAQVRRAAHAARLTPFSLLLGAFALVLSRYSGKRDVVVGTPLAGRHHPAVEETVGHFVDVVPVRVAVDEELTASAFGARVHDAVLDAVQRSDAPFDRIVARVAPERRPGVHPLFQTTFALYNGTVNAFEVPGATVENVPIDPGTAAFDVAVQLVDAGAAVTGYLEYATALFDATLMERVTAAFTRTVAAFARHPDQALTAHDLVADDERAQVLAWGTSAPPAREPGLVHRLVESQVDRVPDGLAIVHAKERLTYAEVEDRANRLANRLLELGAHGGLVGVCVPRTPDLVVAVLAVLKAGAAYVPLDPAYPRERLAYMLEDSSAGIVVTTSALAHGVGMAATVLCVDASAGVDDDARRPAAQVAPDDLAYLIYTSGSTGRPKGVEVTHASVTRLADWFAGFWPPEERRYTLASGSICFDVSVIDTLCPLTAGNCLVLADSALALGRAAAEAPVSLVVTTPSAMAETLRRGEIPASLRAIGLGGEPVPMDLVARLGSRGVRVSDLYGPTETTVCSSARDRGPADPQDLSQPLPGVRLYVLDAVERLVPVGAAGELYIAGAGLARGYHDRPELTAERFRRDPFHDVAGERMYRTGDRMRWRTDGTLEMLGRTDFQVKVRGQRVELGEVEAALDGLEAVDECAVLVRSDASGTNFLAAFVVLHDPDATAASLAGDLRAHLPAHLVPTAWALLDELPRTPSQKVDRRRLEAQALQVTGGDVPPRDPVEADVAAIWEELLGVRAGVRTSFFEVGGHSLLTVRLLNTLEQCFGVGLEVTDLYEAPTIEGLAERLRDGGGRRRGIAVPLSRTGEGPPVTLIHGASGQAIAFHDLAQALPHPVWAIASPAVALAEDAPATVEECATRYLEALLEVQPEGPWVLGGWSFGGLVAVEMARRLEQRDATVASVVLLDTLASGAVTVGEADQAHVNRLVLGEVLAQVGVDLSGHEALAALDPAAQAAYVLEQIESADAVPAGLGSEMVGRMLRTIDAALGATAVYRVPTIRAPITVVRAADDRLLREMTSVSRLPADLGWRAHSLTGVDVVTSPGDHLSMVFDPHAQALAEHLSAIVERIR